MNPFIGRENQLADLESTARLPGAKLVLIKGRRRVGKSRLAQEFAKRHPQMHFRCLTGLPPAELGSGAAALENAAGQLARELKIPPLKPQNSDDLLWHMADQLKGGHTILVLDEINWLGRWDPLFSARLWAVWERTLSQLDNFILILSGSLTGWIDDKFSSNTGYVGRISRNMTLEELPIHDALQFFGNRRSRICLHEQLQILLVTGGIPRYLEAIDPRRTAQENIHDLCFPPSGLLFLEYDQLMNELFQRSNQISRAIMDALVEKPLTLEELRKKLHRQRSGVLSDYVEKLEKSGFLMRFHTWDPHTGRPSNPAGPPTGTRSASLTTMSASIIRRSCPRRNRSDPTSHGCPPTFMACWAFSSKIWSSRTGGCCCRSWASIWPTLSGRDPISRRRR